MNQRQIYRGQFFMLDGSDVRSNTIIPSLSLLQEVVMLIFLNPSVSRAFPKPLHMQHYGWTTYEEGRSRIVMPVMSITNHFIQRGHFQQLSSVFWSTHMGISSIISNLHPWVDQVCPIMDKNRWMSCCYHNLSCWRFLTWVWTWTFPSLFNLMVVYELDVNM